MPTRPRLFVVGENKWTSAGGLVFDRKGRVALVREWKRDELIRTLPKGRLEPGETLEETALREVLEEAGVRGRIVDYVGLVEGKRSFVHYFRMEVAALTKPRDARVHEVRFVEVERALELVSSARDRRVLRAGSGDGAVLEKRRARGR